MKNFKNHNTLASGLTFIEIVLAVFMIASILTSALLWQDTIVFGVSQVSGRLRRTLLLRDELMQLKFRQQDTNEKLPQEKKVATPPTVIRYLERKDTKDSPVQKVQGIVIKQVTAEWREWFGAQQETMIALVYTGTVKEKKQ